jgi:hypothetical protein
MDQPAEMIHVIERRPVFVRAFDRLRECLLASRVLGRLLDEVGLQERFRSEIDVTILRRRFAPVESLARREKIFPLRVRARRIERRNRIAGGLGAICSADKRDDPIAFMDVFLEPLEQRARTSQKLLLHAHFPPADVQIAGELVTTSTELARHGGEKDLHGASAGCCIELRSGALAAESARSRDAGQAQASAG